MNIEKIKEYISLRADLRANGVIGLDPWNDTVHVSYTALVGESDLSVKNRYLSEFPYEVFTNKAGFKIYCIVSKEDFETHFPQLVGYMEEDVNLTGTEDVG